jgi:hypothetical protein
MKLHDIVPLTLNGMHTVDERSEIIKKFTNDPAQRVLLFSNVGAVGLNLTVANIVILFVSRRPSAELLLPHGHAGSVLVKNAGEPDHRPCLAYRPAGGRLCI